MSLDGQQEVDITNLSLEQLSVIKQELDGEVATLESSLQALKFGLSKFLQSKAALADMPKKNDADVLVPLTGSLYIPGTLTNADRVLVDIGTGYLVEKSVKDADAVFERKKKLIETELQKVNSIFKIKERNLETVCMLLQQRIMERAKSQ